MPTRCNNRKGWGTRSIVGYALRGSEQRVGHPPLGSEPTITPKWMATTSYLRIARYLEVSDGVCRLLGYERSELLDTSIDDVSASSTADVDSLWEDYRNSGHLKGSTHLKPVAGLTFASSTVRECFRMGAWLQLGNHSEATSAISESSASLRE